VVRDMGEAERQNKDEQRRKMTGILSDWIG
jgi:hypothetical protein